MDRGSRGRGALTLTSLAALRFTVATLAATHRGLALVEMAAWGSRSAGPARVLPATAELAAVNHKAFHLHSLAFHCLDWRWLTL